MLGEILVAISEQLLAGGKARVAQAADPAEALDQLLQFHIAFSLSRTALITVHFRELVHAPEADRRRVRQLQGEYVEQWVDVLTGLDASLDRTTARAATHAALGLMNSTPYSARLGHGAMRQLLLRMAQGGHRLGRRRRRRAPGRLSDPARRRLHDRQAEAAGEHQPLDLARALADLEDLGVAVEAGDRASPR